MDGADPQTSIPGSYVCARRPGGARVEASVAFLAEALAAFGDGDT
jgi:hypothetical protein